jgi:hypothetical protein
MMRKKKKKQCRGKKFFGRIIYYKINKKINGGQTNIFPMVEIFSNHRRFYINRKKKQDVFQN